MANQNQKREYWFHHIKQWQESGISRSDYLKKHDLSASSFGYFLKRYTSKPEEVPAKASQPSLMPIDVIPEPAQFSAPEQQPINDAFIVTTPNGYRIELPSGFDLQSLQQIIRMVQPA